MRLGGDSNFYISVPFVCVPTLSCFLFQQVSVQSQVPLLIAQRLNPVLFLR